MFYRVDERVSRSCMPLTSEEFRFLKEIGVNSLISLESLTAAGRAHAERLSLSVIDLPLADGALPRPEQVEEFLEAIGRELKAGRKVHVHCAAGRQRTALMVGFYLIAYRGLAPLAAYWEVDQRFLGDWPAYKQFLLEHGAKVRDALCFRAAADRPGSGPERR